MKQRRQSRGGRKWWAVFAVSILLHLGLIAGVLPNIFSFDVPPLDATKTADAAADQKFEVSVVTEDELAELNRPEPTPPTPMPLPEPVEKEEPPEPPPEVVEPEKDKRKTVAQVTNEERPEEANYVSQEDNATEEETRARETTTAEVLPSNTEHDTEPARLAKAEVPDLPQPAQQRDKPRPLADPSELIKRTTEAPEPTDDGALPQETRRKLFEITPDQYSEVVGHEHDEAAHQQMQDKRLLAGWEEDQRVLRGALENFITEVKPGNHTSVNSHGRAWADYLGRIHRKIHVRWATGYLATLDIREDASSPLNNPQLNTKLEFVIRASDGAVDRINIVRSSGELRFDAEAILISKSIGPHPSPPRELVSPDGNVYVHWNFWRDQRQCGVFGASVFLVEKDEG